MDRGFVTWDTLQTWLDCSPDGNLERGHATASTTDFMLPPKVFVTGAFSRAAFHGLRRGTNLFPWLTCLLCPIVRRVAPSHKFTTITWARNVMTMAHKDFHNDADSQNLVLPCSVYHQGELLLASPAGDIQLSREGARGSALSTQVPHMFNPRSLHATMPWTGQRLILISFHVRDADRLSTGDMHLCSLGFYPMEYAYKPGFASLVFGSR